MIYYATNGNAAQVAERMVIINKTLLDPKMRALFRSKLRNGLGQRATVAILVGMTAPVLAMSIALGIEVSGWSVMKQRLQRAADTAAIAAAESYMTGASAQTAATYGAYLAELNNVAGASTRSWTGSSTAGTLSDNNISVVVASGSGVINPTDTTFAVTVQSPAPTMFVRFAFPSGITKTIATSATAEIAAGAGTGGQPCLLTLQDYNGGTTVGYGVQVSGAATVNGSSCTIRSDDGISLTGSASIKAASVYTSGAISEAGASSITATTIASSQPQIPDPYASSTTVQNGITNAGTCSGGTAYSQTQVAATISPGCYSSIYIAGVGNVTMNPGVYYVTGNITVTASGQLSGTGVTIFSNGTFTISGASPVTLTPPTSGATSGILYASNSTSATTFTASGAISFTGLFYYPKGAVTVSGASTNGTANGCGEMIVKSITFSGSASLAANCGTYGLLSFSALPGASTAALVQ
jgi:Flp pilus assembly protein TadG